MRSFLAAALRTFARNSVATVRRILLIVALAVVITPALLFAHAMLVRSEPAKDAVLTSPPAEIRLWFSEEPDVRFSRVDLTGPNGRPIEVGTLGALSPNGLRVPIPSKLLPGAYVIFWRTAASDGHATNGRFHFTVAGDTSTAAAAATPPQASRIDTNSAHRSPQTNAVIAPTQTVTTSTALRWAEFIALLIVIGAIIFQLAIVPAAKWPDDLVADASDRARRLAVAFAVLLLVTMFTRALSEAQLLPQPYSSRFAAVESLITTTRWGVAWSIGALGVIIAFAGLLVARAGLAGWIVAALGVVMVTVSEGLTGHSGSSSHLSIAMAMDVAHQLAAGGWLGGLACVIIAGFRATRRLDEPEARAASVQLVRSYHHSAVECVALLIVSGVVAAALRLHAFSDLWTTPYGSMLFRKLVFVVIALAIGLYHWRRVVIPDWTDRTRARFNRSATFELVVFAVVVAFTALLVSTPLPR